MVIIPDLLSAIVKKGEITRTSKERGIRQFKEKWGGQYAQYVNASWAERN